MIMILILIVDSNPTNIRTNHPSHLLKKIKFIFYLSFHIYESSSLP